MRVEQRGHVAQMRVVAALALEGPGQAHEVVVVIQIARARAFNLLRIAAEVQRALASGISVVRAFARRALIDQAPGPRRFADWSSAECAACPPAACPSGPPRSFAPGRPEIPHRPECAAMCHPAVALQRRRNLLQPRLPRGVERSRAEVVHIAGHQQAQRGCASIDPGQASARAGWRTRRKAALVNPLANT
jgi:hypothetical protein